MKQPFLRSLYLKLLMMAYLAEVKESTRLKQRKAYEGLRNFLGEDTLPHQLTDVQVRDYVDLLKRSDLSPNTIRDKLSSLGGL